MPKRERYVWVCINRRADDHPKGSCAVAGSEAFHTQLKQAVARAGLTDRVRVMTSSCLDICWMGAALVITPEMAFLGRVTDADIPSIVEALGSSENLTTHPAIASKIVPPEQFTDPAATATVSIRRKS